MVVIQTQTESPCIRCGKTRVIDKVWKEYLGKILVTHTKTVCPDADCQKVVEEEIAARREKRELLANRHSSSLKKPLKLNSEKKNSS